MDLKSFTRIGALWILIAACCGFALWAPPALWKQVTAVSSAQAGDDALVWWDEAWPVLLQDEPAWLLAERGAELVALDDEFQIQRGFALLERALEHAQGDAHALLRVSTSCSHPALHDWCSSHGVLGQLIDADPENALSYLVALTRSASLNSDQSTADTPTSRALVANAARAPRFQTHRHLGFSDMLNAVDAVLDDIPLDDEETRNGRERYQDAARLVFTRLSMRPTVAYGKLIRYCEQAVVNSVSGTVGDCESIAVRMQKNSSSYMDRRIGFEMERRMRFVVNPSDPEVQRLARLSRVWGVTRGCQLKTWMDTLRSPATDAGIISRWAQDLEELGEIEVADWTDLLQFDSEAPGSRTGNCAIALAELERDEADWAVRTGDFAGVLNPESIGG